MGGWQNQNGQKGERTQAGHRTVDGDGRRCGKKDWNMQTGGNHRGGGRKRLGMPARAMRPCPEGEG